ncbi:HNH endonuclease [Pseudomonas sp.]
MDGYTWHHHQDSGRMQLVPELIHKKTGHILVAKLWGVECECY